MRSEEELQYQQYRSLSFLAVAAFVFGLLSVPTGVAANMNPILLVFPFLGMLIGLTAVLKLRNRTNEFTGLGLAKTGLMLSTILLFAGAAYAAYVYATEVPEGFERISFTDLKPDPRYPQVPWSPKSQELVGQKVFVKGYVYPDNQRGAIKRFVLVPDMGTCCFGGKPKISDMIQVTLEDPLRVEYSMMRRSLAGEFRLGLVNVEKVDEVMYHLEASYVK